jgi:hypothetical protein
MVLSSLSISYSPLGGFSGSPMFNARSNLFICCEIINRRREGHNVIEKVTKNERSGGREEEKRGEKRGKRGRGREERERRGEEKRRKREKEEVDRRSRKKK